MISLSTLCTKSRIKEFLVTKKTLELHHECIWYSVCDQETADYFKDDDKFIPVKIVDKEGKHYVGDNNSAKDFFELVMNKMVAMKKGIERQGYTLFLDTDLVFLSPLDDSFFSFLENKEKTLFLTSHCHTDGHRDNEQMYGTYNVGMLACKDVNFADSWEKETVALNCPHGLEQKSVTTIANRMMESVIVAPPHYNYGWWRNIISDDMNKLTVEDNKLTLYGNEVINLHAHTDPNNSRGAYEVNFLNVIFQKMSQTTSYDEVFSIIREVYGMK